MLTEPSTDPPVEFGALVRAVRSGDVAAARKALQNSPGLARHLDRPAPDSFGSPLLFAAVGNEDLPMIDLLLVSGADINARSDWWAGPFHVLETCPPAFAPALISLGATVGAHAAARLGMVDTLRALIEADPTVVHSRAGDGKSPLHYASTPEVAVLLLKHGADIDMLDVDHESTPAQWLVREQPDVARLLVTRGARSDILLAASLGAAELVRRHLDADPACIGMRVSREWFRMRDPRAGGPIYLWTIGGGKGALDIARENGHDEVVALLVDRSSHA